MQATGQRIGILLQGVGSVGLALVLAMYFEWRVGLVALAFFPIVIVVIYHQAKATNKESRCNAKTLESSTKVNFLSTAFNLALSMLYYVCIIM